MDPAELFYSPTHEWVHFEGETATVGISRFAVDQLSDLTMIDLPEVGRRLEQGKSFGEIESVKSVSDLYAPVAGEVIEVNSAVANDLQILSEDPYNKGWLIRIKLDNPSRPEGLLDYPSYQKQIADDAH